MLSVTECERVAEVVRDVPPRPGTPAPAVSVIVPVHNEPEARLRRCLDSLLAQTFPGEIEALLIDDASTDDSLARCIAYADACNTARVRFRVLRLYGNSGNAALPRNIGVAYSRGKYLAFLDSDDFMTADSYERLYNTAEADELDLIIFGIREAATAEHAEGYEVIPTQAQVDLGVTDIAALGYVVGSVCGSVTDHFIRRSLFSDNSTLEFVGFRYLDDTVVGYMSLVLSRRVRFVAECFYRATSDGGRKEHHLMLADIIDVWLEIKKRLGERYIRELEHNFDNAIVTTIASGLMQTTDPDIIKYILDKVQTVFIPNTYLTTAPQREFIYPHYRDLLKTWRKITPERFCELNGIARSG